MKKALSVILVLFMLLACMPLTLADDVIGFTTSGSFSGTNDLESGKTYEIRHGVTMTVPEWLTLSIPLNCTLIVAEGATLDVKGEILVSKNEEFAGHLKVYGSIKNANKVSGEGEKTAYITFPSLSSQGYDPSTLQVWQATSGSAEDYLTDGFSYTRVPNEGMVLACPLNGYLFIKTDIVKDDDINDKKYDDAKMGVTLTNHPEFFVGDAGIKSVKIVDTGTVNYSRWTNDDDFLKEYTVTLTSGKGYETYDANGNSGTIPVKYGKTFLFRVEFDEDFSYSATTAEVMLYNGKGVVTYNIEGGGMTIEPDEFGWYKVEKVEDDYTVFISTLPMNDDTVLKVGGILQTIKSVFAMILNFFRKIASTLGIRVNTTPATGG